MYRAKADEDEILVQEAREQLRESGCDEDSAEELLSAMADEGVFRIPEWT